MRLRWIGLAFAISTPVPASAQELPSDLKARIFARTGMVHLARPVTSVPMRGTDHAGNSKCPYFQVSVNGSGPFTFLYDTGATYLIISSKVAAAAQATMVFDRHGRRDVVHVDRLTLGGVEASDLLAIVDDSFGVDGVMGFPTLGDVNVLFDFSRREILLSRSPIKMPGSFNLPYTRPGGVDVPAIPVGIGGRTVPILIDTGDDAYALEIRSIELGDAAITHPPVTAAVVMNGAHRQRTATTRLRDPVTLGPMRALNAEIAINDELPVGDIGYDALRQFRFQISPTQQMVTFQPLARGTQFRLESQMKPRH